jgi:hypothetical protein
MPVDPNDQGQGWIEYLLVIVLVALIIWIVWTLLGPAITKWIGEFLNGI